MPENPDCFEMFLQAVGKSQYHTVLFFLSNFSPADEAKKAQMRTVIEGLGGTFENGLKILENRMKQRFYDYYR